MKLAREITDDSKPCAGSTFRIPDGARILIVCDEDASTEPLKSAFREAGFICDSAKSITAGCDLARSGQFQVVVSTPLLSDGSWRRFIDIANHYDLGFEVVLLARDFDHHKWAETLEAGAFEVLDVVCELPKAAEMVKRAFWAACLKGAGPQPRVASPPKGP